MLLWVLAGVAVWLVLGVLVALTAGRGAGIADDREPPARVRARPEPVPLPRVGVGLILVVLALEATGYITRLVGWRGVLADVLSMDGAFSLPRLVVAGLFAVSAVAAGAGAARQPGRRPWWLAVALVGTGTAVVKAGSTLHVEDLGTTSAVLGAAVALLLSGVLAGAVVGGLWFLSRHERRDRRRVLSALTLYAVASVGLAALSSAVAAVYGTASGWAAAATFVEESGEALGGVAFLVAVLVGVAPRRMLPPSWPLRRRADAPTSVVEPRSQSAVDDLVQRGSSPSR